MTEQNKTKSKKKKKKKEFSKALLIQESVLIWITTFALIALAFFCMALGYLGSLPWITAMAGFPWTAYGVSQAFYYNKSKAENTKGGIRYASVIDGGGDPSYNKTEESLNDSATNTPDIDIWGEI